MESLIRAAFKACFGTDADEVVPVTPHASPRKLFRLRNTTVGAIGSYNPDRRDDDSFWWLTHHFRSYGLPMPELYFRDAEKGLMLMEDLGNHTLLDIHLSTQTEECSFSPQAEHLYKTALTWLPHIQVRAGKELDFSKCYPRESFDRESILWDVHYYMKEYLERVGITFDKEKLLIDAEAIVQYVGMPTEPFFMYRDFQARNIMVRDHQMYFIDYQQGRRGPLEYDVVSLLYQSRADLKEEARESLLNLYLEALSKLMPIDEFEFRNRFQCFVLVRLMQVLGTYGKLGLGERKEYFVQAIPFALKNVRQVLAHLKIPVEIPEIERTLTIVSSRTEELCSL